jgi:sulfate transport system permease protein
MTSVPLTTSRYRHRRGDTAAARWTRRGLIAVALLLLFWMLVFPLVVVFAEALGLPYAISAGPTWDAVWLTVITAAISVPLNVVFGIAAAWCVTKFDFTGKSLLLTLIDLPFAISPVVAGLALLLVYGERGGLLAPWVNQLYEVDLGPLGVFEVSTKIVFAVPGIVLATVFITFPFVARELIPLMQAQGTEEETAARVLGARGWQTFVKVTLPNIKWGLLYGVILCNARAIGEFGAVFVVTAGHADQVTLPLHVERVYYANMVRVVPAFAVASLLAAVAVITLIVKAAVEWKFKAQMRKKP